MSDGRLVWIGTVDRHSGQAMWKRDVAVCRCHGCGPVWARRQNGHGGHYVKWETAWRIYDIQWRQCEKFGAL